MAYSIKMPNNNLKLTYFGHNFLILFIADFYHTVVLTEPLVHGGREADYGLLACHVIYVCAHHHELFGETGVPGHQPQRLA